MHILLLILKIIGITLLSVIGVVLLLLCLVLFVPVRYKITADKEAEGDFTAHARASWLLHLINLRCSYVGELEYVLRIIVFPLYRSDNLISEKEKARKLKKEKRKEEREAKKKEKERIKEEKKQRKQGQNEEMTDTPETGEPERDENNTASDSGLSADLLSVNEITDSECEDTAKDTEGEGKEESDDEAEEENIPLSEKIREYLEKIVEILFNIKDKIKAFLLKIYDIKENIDYYLDALNDEKNQQTIKMCLERLGKVLKNIKPQKFKAYAHLGMEDPHSLGQILAIYSIIYPLVHENIQIEPEFDREITEGNVFIKGRITLAVILWQGFRIYFNKDFRRLQKVFGRK